MTSREEFIEKVEKWSKKIGVEYKEIHFRKMKRKWASCSARGRLTFDPELLQQEESFQDEAIVHELLHLRYPYHSRLFKQMLALYLKKGEGEQLY